MADLGYKKLTIDNWKKPDTVARGFVKISESGETHSITEDGWVSDILKPTLKEGVPLEVQKMFEVARGAIIYGYFFYPLYTLAGEQLFRVVEAAVAIKCKSLGATGKVDTFQKEIEHLIEKNVIPPQEKEWWDAIRQLRNSSSHPGDQSIVTPPSVIGLLEQVADTINSLYITS